MNEYENIKSEKVIESIKSSYVLKDIFSFLSEKQKLKIIIYNKNLQKKIDINIENYKRIARIYKKITKNGKEKEYYIYQLIEKYLKENIKMEKEMEKEKNIIIGVNYYLKENI